MPANPANGLFRKYPKIYKVRKKVEVLRSHILANRVALALGVEPKLVKNILKKIRDITKAELLDGNSVALLPSMLTIGVGLREPKFASKEQYEQMAINRAKKAIQKKGGVDKFGREIKVYELSPLAFKKRLFVYTSIDTRVENWLSEFGDEILEDGNWKPLASRNKSDDPHIERRQNIKQKLVVDVMAKRHGLSPEELL